MKEERIKRKPEFPNRWILDNNGIPIEVNIWQSSSYRHGSDWDFTNYIETLDGKRVFSDTQKWKEFPGYDSSIQALKQKL